MAEAVSSVPHQLRELLERPTACLVDDLRADLVTAAYSLSGWLEHRFDERNSGSRESHESRWKALAEDFTDAAGEVGPRVRQVLGTRLSTARTLAEWVREKPDQVSREFRERAGPVLRALCDQWGRHEVLLAGWDDLVSCCKDVHARWGVLAMRRDLFCRLLEQAGRSVRKTASRLHGVLGDVWFDVMTARVELGDMAEFPEPIVIGPAGLTGAERLDLSRRLLAVQPPPVHHVVWVGFSGVPPSMRHGASFDMASFHPSSYLAMLFREGEPARDCLPPEFRRPDSLDARRVVERADCMLVRIDLGIGHFSDPVTEAANRARRRLDSIGLLSEDDPGQRLRGHIHVVDGAVVSVQHFEPERTVPGIGGRFAGDLQYQLTDGIANSKSEAISALHADIRKWHEAAKVSPSIAIRQYGTIIERCRMAVTDVPWYRYAEQYFKDAWIRGEINGAFQAVFESFGRIPRMPEPDRQVVNELRQSLLRRTADSPDGRIDIGEAIPRLTVLASRFPPHDRLGRQLSELASRCGTVVALKAWHEDARRRFKRGLNRLRWVRNAAEHGGPLTDEIARTVHTLANELARAGLYHRLADLASGSDPGESHKEARDRFKALRLSLGRADRLSEIRW